MTPSYQHQSGHSIVHDPALLTAVDARAFDPAYWQEKNAIARTASGRAEVHFINTGTAHWVLRHYRRGGLIGKVVHDRYLWTGLGRTRAWREWHLLAQLHDSGFPVPRPVAARVRREGPFYRADLLTNLIEGAEPLAGALMREALPPTAWVTLGETIARFHNAGVHHSDLNARNVLWRSSEETFFLLDFDGARLGASQVKLASGIPRLRRSLDKFAHKAAETSTPFHFDESGWQALLAAYAQAR